MFNGSNPIRCFLSHMAVSELGLNTALSVMVSRFCNVDTENYN